MRATRLLTMLTSLLKLITKIHIYTDLYISALSNALKSDVRTMSSSMHRLHIPNYLPGRKNHRTT